MNNFWKAQIASGEARPLTLDDLHRGIDALKVMVDQPPVHLIRSRDWCDVCGPRQFWSHAHPLDVGK